MIESKLKAKNANSGQLFRPGWVSQADNLVPRVSPLPAPWSERPGRREEERPWERGWSAECIRHQTMPHRIEQPAQGP